MFLIYNFHLHESKKQKIRPNYVLKIENRLQRSLCEDDFYNISIYGIEAFYFSSLKLLDDHHLFEAWKKLNRLWTLLNQKLTKDALSNEEQKHLSILKSSLIFKDYFKIATSIDHLIKEYEKINVINIAFIELLKFEFPFLILA